MTGSTETDILVIGSGAGGLSVAVTAAKDGLDVIVAEKDAVFGGTTARSGGWLWIPSHPMQKEIGVSDGGSEHLPARSGRRKIRPRARQRLPDERPALGRILHP